ncbi:MAG: hypothetical protein WD768_01150 [Phycisphaeraceae bacterium]
MIADPHRNLIARWVRAGIAFNIGPARHTPDLERLLLKTVRFCEQNSRLFIMVATWLTIYGTYVARHRLKRLALAELTADERAILGLLLESAIDAGATGELRTVLEACAPAAQPRPLFIIDRNKVTQPLVKKEATAASRRWNLWIQPFELKRNALRTAAWVLATNPAWRDRALRRGDLRCSILESLRHDAPAGRVQSESQLARLCGATRTAVRRALDDLEKEGHTLRTKTRTNRRDQAIYLPCEKPIGILGLKRFPSSSG